VDDGKDLLEDRYIIVDAASIILDISDFIVCQA